jgi:hypothetical protein
MKKFIIKLVSDIKNIIFFFSINTEKNVCIFNENENTFQYLEYYLKKKTCGIIFFSLEKINYNYNQNVHVINLYNKFFIEIFFLCLKSKFIYSTTPGLNYTIFKKSILSIKSKYIYIQHSPVSLTMAYDKNAFTEFNAVQTINKFQYSEINKINNDFSKKIRPFKSKYKYLDYKNQKKKKQLLIAPTWKTNFYSSGFYLELFNELTKKKIDFIFRPHYMSLKEKEINLSDLNFIKNKIDVGPNIKISEYENLVSDWSGIFLEFIIFNKKKPYLFNSKKKVLNINYNERYSKTTIEEYARENVCFSYNFDQIDLFINDLKNNDNYKQLEINKFIYENFY